MRNLNIPPILSSSDPEARYDSRFEARCDSDTEARDDSDTASDTEAREDSDSASESPSLDNGSADFLGLFLHFEPCMFNRAVRVFIIFLLLLV